MDFIKNFIITLVIYLVLNLIFVLIGVFTMDPVPTDAGILIVAGMFGPIVQPPMLAWVDGGIIAIIQLISAGGDATLVLSFLYYILPPLIAVIVGGLLADSTMIAFLSWFGTAVVSIIVYLILFGVAMDILDPAYLLWAAYGPTDLYIALLLFGLINAFLYGCISFLVTRKKL